MKYQLDNTFQISFNDQKFLKIENLNNKFDSRVEKKENENNLSIEHANLLSKQLVDGWPVSRLHEQQKIAVVCSNPVCWTEKKTSRTMGHSVRWFSCNKYECVCSM